MPDPVFQHGRYCFFKGRKHHFKVTGLNLAQVQVVVTKDPSTTYTVTWDPDDSPVVNHDGTVLHFATTPHWDASPPPDVILKPMTSWALFLVFLKSLFGSKTLLTGSDDLTYVSYDDNLQTLTLNVADPQYYDGP